MTWLPIPYWLYLTALSLGAVLGLLASLGGDGDADADADADADGDAEHDADVDVSSLWALLGIGRVPLGTLLTLDLLAFGGVGVIASELLRLVLPVGVASTCALPIALLLGPFLGGSLARAVARWLPATESHGASRLELIGRLGRAELVIDSQFGRARVRDDGGAEHLLRCVTTGTPLAPGAELVVTDVDAETGLCTVVPADLQLIRGSRD